jgi:hypothetical protein
VIILGINRDRGNNILDFGLWIADLDYTSSTKGGLTGYKSWSSEKFEIIYIRIYRWLMWVSQ